MKRKCEIQGSKDVRFCLKCHKSWLEDQEPPTSCFAAQRVEPIKRFKSGVMTVVLFGFVFASGQLLALIFWSRLQDLFL